MKTTATTLMLALVYAATTGCVTKSFDIATSPDKASPAAPITVFKYLGSVQCSGGGKSLPQLKDELAQSGVQVLGSSCGSDGLIRPMVCGAGDGRIAIFEIPGDQIKAASSAGFQPLVKLPQAARQQCQ